MSDENVCRIVLNPQASMREDGGAGGSAHSGPQAQGENMSDDLGKRLDEDIEYLAGEIWSNGVLKPTLANIREVRAELKRLQERAEKAEAYVKAFGEWERRVGDLAGHSEYMSWPHVQTIENFVTKAAQHSHRLQERVAELEKELDGVRGGSELMTTVSIADEREACAVVADDRTKSYRYETDPWAQEHISEAKHIAKAIRARASVLAETESTRETRQHEEL